MIVAHYPNPNKPVKTIFPVTPVKPLGTSNDVMGNGLTRGHNAYYARKHNIDIEEFVRRDKLVMQCADQAKHLEIGKEYFPFSKDQYEKRGKCRIKYVCRRYSDFDVGTWNDKEYQFIVGAVDSHGKTLVTTANFFFDTEPKE